MLFTRALARFRVQESSTVFCTTLKRSVSFKFFVNYLDCCSVSDDLSLAVKLENCHTSSVCTLLHRQDHPRCTSHLHVGSVNVTFLRVPQCRRCSPSTLSNDNRCSSSTFSSLDAKFIEHIETTETESISWTTINLCYGQERTASACVVDGGSQVTNGKREHVVSCLSPAQSTRCLFTSNYSKDREFSSGCSCS